MSNAGNGKKTCFVIGPIGTEDSEERLHADWLLEEIIAPVFENFPEYNVDRADKLAQPGLIDAQIINLIIKSELAIADLSMLNPNAFYEIGIRHMVQKPIIHMHRVGEIVPFDVKLYRSIPFARSRPSELRAARDNLKAQVQAIIAPHYQVENPVTNAMGRMHLQTHATPEQRVLIDELRTLSSRIALLERRSHIRSDDGQNPIIKPTIENGKNFIEIDLMDFGAPLYRFEYKKNSDVTDLLDSIWKTINIYYHLEAFTYRKIWILIDEHGAEITDIGTAWAEDKGGVGSSDNRLLSAVGIVPGRPLKAVKIRGSSPP